MSKVNILPDDVRKICIQIANGYDRRVRKYNDRRQEIIEGTSCHHEVLKDPDDPDDWEKSSWAYQPMAHNASRTTEDIASRLLGLEEQPETKRMRAVEQARLQIGLDLPEDIRKKLTDAIILNCKSGRRYPYRVLDVEGFSERGFYRERESFLTDIAIFLNLL